MTGYTVHTGSNEKFSNGWDRIFKNSPQQQSSKKNEKTPAKSTSKQAKKKSN